MSARRWLRAGAGGVVQEFDVMKQYDVTGVGLNLGTAEEFTRKVPTPPPLWGE